MDAATTRMAQLGLPVIDDRRAILAEPPGRRDLGAAELWDRSLARSRRRRAAAAARLFALPKAATARISAALIAAGVVAQAGTIAPPPAAAATSGGGTAGAGLLRHGARGSGVVALQQALGIPADGVFGPQTRSAVRAYQRAHGLVVDGIVGPRTRAALGLAAPVATTAETRTAAPSAVAAALSKVGAPYAYGSTGPSSFDCSGLTSWAFRQAGIAIPRTSFAQFGAGAHVATTAIQAGDLVFFDTAGPGASDVGIATGPTTVVSATTHGVMAHAIFDGYWGSHLVGARRVG